MPNEQNKDKNEEQELSIKKHLEKKKSESLSREEYFERIKPHILEKSFRIEMFYDEENKIFIIQGDANGLEAFGQSIISAGIREKVGYHNHWDRRRVTDMNVKEVIVRRVASYNQHQKADSD